MSRCRWSCPALLALFLSACGGGGGSGGTDGHDGAVLTGQFIDSPVSGLRYITPSRSGVTNSDGQFEYLRGETVSFLVGELLLGDARGAATVTVFDLVDGIDPPVGNALRTAITDGERVPGFSRVVNLATLLQTLDADGNPGNGIEIAAGIAALFAAGSVDLDVPWEDFARERGFRRILAEAKSLGLLDGARQVRKPWRAMEHLYASMRIDSLLRANTGYTSDTPGDPYRSVSATLTFDTEGQLIRHEIYRPGGRIPGTIREIHQYAYDAAGNGIRFEYYLISDDRPVRVTTHTFDSDGNRIREDYDTDGDGRPNHNRTLTYNAIGNPVREEIDGDGNGTPDRIVDYTYDDNDQRIREEYRPAGGGAPDFIMTYAYDDNGYRTREEYDDDADGTPDRVYTYNFDDSGNLIRLTYSHSRDGTPVTTRTYAYDDKGNLIREEYSYGGPGRPEIVVRNYDFDDNGNLIREEWITEGTLVRVYTYSFDNNGFLIRETIDYGADGMLDEVRTYTYDGNGNLLREVLDHGGDGMPFQTRIFIYDAIGNRVREEFNRSGDGTETIFTWEYAAHTSGWWSAFNPGYPY